VSYGVQVQSPLKSLATSFADEFIAQAETRAEKLGSSLGVMAAIFYFTAVRDQILWWGYH